MATHPEWGYFDSSSTPIGGTFERVYVKLGPKRDFRLYARYNFDAHPHYYTGKLAGKLVNTGWATEEEARDYLDRLAVARGWKEATWP